MPTYWPASLPSTPLLQGLSYTPQTQVVRTPMDIGPPKLRRRTSAEVTPFSARLVLTGAQLATLRTFFFTTLAGGALTFTWLEPTTGASVTMQFRGPYTATPLRAHGFVDGRLYDVAVDLEIVP